MKWLKKLEIRKIGIIGAAGGMGECYAKAFANAGFTVNAFDKRKKELRKLSGKNFVLCNSIKQVLENSDYSIYCTPIDLTPQIIEQTIHFAKPGLIVGGFTSIKKFEIQALKKAPKGVKIITAHPLHAPGKIDGQQVAVVRVNGAKKQDVLAVQNCFHAVGANTFVVSGEKHDKTMANTQVITHFTLLNMALAWKVRGKYPSTAKNYVNSVDGLKTDMALRLFTQNPQVYAGIAMLNPDGIRQMRVYNHVLNEIIEAEQKKDLDKISRLWAEAKEFCSKNGCKKAKSRLKKLFGQRGCSTNTKNSHISLLAMALTWKHLGIKPSHLGPLQSPPYKIRWLLVNQVINSNTNLFADNAVNNDEAKRIDLAYAAAARTWAYIIESGDTNNYVIMWDQLKDFFGNKRINAAKKRIDSLVEKLVQTEKNRV